MSLKWTDEVPYLLNQVGGVRIARITDYDPISKKSNHRLFEYKQTSDDDNSGYVLSGPKFYRDFYTLQVDNVASDYVILSSTNIAPLLTTQGSYVGYSEVTEYFATLLSILKTRGRQ
jgi:hypothetical protein